MNEKHPNRKKDKHNPYTLMIVEGRYYLSFKDGRGVMQNIEIEKVLYDLFNRFELEDISYLNRVSRHIEHSELTENSLNDRVFYKEESLEETVSRCIEYELLHKAISNCPKHKDAGCCCIFSESCPMSRLPSWRDAPKWRLKEALTLH